MSIESNKEVIRRWWEAMNQGKALDLIDVIYASDYLLHDPSVPNPVRGLAGVRGFVAMLQAAFPDQHCTIETLTAEEDRVSHVVTVRGTHRGVFQGIPATGKSFEITVRVVSRFVDGKIAEEWELFDALGLMQQLGVLPLRERSMN